MKKTFELTDTKAIRVSGVKINDKPYISIRQMYRKKGEKSWQHAKQGLNIPMEDEDQAKSILKFAVKVFKADPDTFEELEFDK